MLNSIAAIIKSTLQSNNEGLRQGHEDAQLIEALSGTDEMPEPLAYAILLLALARADGDVHGKEDAVISNVLARTFPELQGEPTTTMQTAHNMLDSFRDPQSFVARIKAQYSPQERTLLLNTIRKIITADDVEEPIEDYIEKKYAKYLA